MTPVISLFCVIGFIITPLVAAHVEPSVPKTYSNLELHSRKNYRKRCMKLEPIGELNVRKSSLYLFGRGYKSDI